MRMLHLLFIKRTIMSSHIILIIQLAGFLQIALCIGSLLIPKLLNWKAELSNVSKIISQIFWTYAGYILVINLFFGLISIFGAAAFLEKSFFSKAISVFIFLYWLTRIIIQFFYFDTKSAPQGFIYKLGEIALICLFIFFTAVYGWVTALNYFEC
ncbi:MAG: hypothetical protein JWO44_411 [Bacteroidetes bacterium]|nr:hypothetical protein [Bacteroidota bacterium]